MATSDENSRGHPAAGAARAPRDSVTVRVPATSANLGPGFDSIGMAVDMWSEITLERDSSEGKANIGPLLAHHLPITPEHVWYSIHTVVSLQTYIDSFTTGAKLGDFVLEAVGDGADTLPCGPESKKNLVYDGVLAAFKAAGVAPDCIPALRCK